MLKYTGKVINIKFTEQLIPEFPNLLFGRQNEQGRVYFDATSFIKSKGLSLSVDQFLKEYDSTINAIISTAHLNEAEMCYINTEGHIAIDSSLVYLFISFVEPRFLLYMFDRMDELFSRGFAVSDTYLLHHSRNRIPQEVLTAPRDDTSKQ